MRIDHRANVTPNQIQDKGYRTSAADTLRSVASMFRISPSSLARANNLSPDAKLVQGMNLTIPTAKVSNAKSGHARVKDVFTLAPRSSVFDQRALSHEPAAPAGPKPVGSRSHIIDGFNQLTRRAEHALDPRELKNIKDEANAIRVMHGNRDRLSSDLTNPGGRDNNRNPDGIEITKYRGRGANAVGLAGRRPSKGAGGFENPLGRYSPSMPSNAGKGPSRLVGPPSADPRDWVSGSSSQEGRLPSTPIVEQTGERTTVTWNPDERTSVRWERTTRDVPSPDPNTLPEVVDRETLSITRTDEQGGKHTVNYNRDTNGDWVESTRSYTLPREGADKLLDPSADSPGSGVNPITGLPDGPRTTFIPDKVNPGPEGETEQPEAPLIEIDRRELVGDPGAVRSGTINPSETQKRFHTPPDPGPRPSDPND